MYKIFIVSLIILSFLGKNKPLGIACIFIFIISFINTKTIVPFIQKHFLNIGMTFLMIWMLIPLIESNKTLPQNIKDIKNLITLNGIISFLCGIIVVLLASKGINLLKKDTHSLTGIIIGSIIGVTFLGGIPVGPLVASGIAYEIIKITKL